MGGVVLVNLIQLSAAQLSNGVGLDQGAQLVVGEHVNVSSGGRILSNLGTGIAFGANAELPSDVILGMSGCELVADSLQIVVILGLVLAGTPNGQGDLLGGSIVASGSALGLLLCGLAGSKQTDDHHAGQSQSNDLLHFEFPPK